MALNNDVKVTIQDGGLGRLPAGKDFYTGVIFQSATKPTEYGTDDIKRVYSLKDAESKGITVASFPVEHYHVSEFFRVCEKFGVNALLDVGFYNINPLAYTGAEIISMQDNANGELRQIGVFFTDTYALDFLTASNTAAETLNGDGFPVSIYIAADVTDYTTLVDLRTNDKQWVSFILAQDGGGTGAALFASEGYSISAIGAILGITAVAEVQQRIGNMSIPFDLSGITELQTLAVLDGTLISAIADSAIDTLTTQGYTLLVKRRITGSYVYTDALTASADTSDYTEQRFNRVIGKAKRNLLSAYSVVQNAEIYVDPTTGYMDKKTVSYLEQIGLDSLRGLATLGNISYDRESGDIPRKSIQIDPAQDVLTTNKILVNAKVVPVGAVSEMDISLSLTTSIS